MVYVYDTCLTCTVIIMGNMTVNLGRPYDEIKGKLFSRLQRGKTKTAGRGLGLYLSKTLVEDFHGKIWVEDKVAGDYHQGSRFVVLLPAVQEKSHVAKGASTGQ